MPQHNMIESIFQLDEPNIIIYNRKKTDYIRIAPTTGTSEYANQSGQINFEINNQQYFTYLPEAFIHCEFDLYKKTKAGETRLTPADNITLENNFFPKLFSSMQLDVGTGTLETLISPGVYDDMLRHTTFGKSLTDTSAQMQGWIPDTNCGDVVKTFTGTTATSIKIKEVKQGTTATDIKVNNANEIAKDVDVANPTALSELYTHFNADNLGGNHGFSKRVRQYNRSGHFVSKWKLSPLFGYLGHKKISYQLRYVFRLTRNTNNNATVFYGDTSFTDDAIIKINRIELWLPQIQPSLEVEAFLNKRLSSNAPIPIIYMKRITMSPISVMGDSYSFMVASGVTNTPRYVLIAFKPANNPSVYVNESQFFIEGPVKFDPSKKKWTDVNGKEKGAANYQSVRLEHIELQLNNVNYPNQPIRVKYDYENDYMEAYTEYENMCYNFGVIPPLTPNDWRNIHPIFCFDTSSQNEDLKKGGITARVNVKFNSNPQGNLRAYALLLEDSYQQINVINGVMVNII